MTDRTAGVTAAPLAGPGRRLATTVPVTVGPGAVIRVGRTADAPSDGFRPSGVSGATRISPGPASRTASSAAACRASVATSGFDPGCVSRYASAARVSPRATTNCPPDQTRDQTDRRAGGAGCGVPGVSGVGVVVLLIGGSAGRSRLRSG